MTGPLRTAADLVAAGLVRPEQRAEIERVAAHYAVAVTPTLAALIDRTDPHDPIARQFVPDPAELVTLPHERDDPIGDDPMSPVEGVVHRHPDRVLLKFVHVCPVYCRFCFRRAMVGPGGRPTLSPDQIAAALGYVRAHPEIREVIFSGGDPLMLSPRRLRDVVREIAAIDHVGILRIHTRLPVAAPERITPELVRALRLPDRPTYVVLHANHPRELTAAVRAACARFVDAGMPMLSQSVLIKGVNDDEAVLAELMWAFVACRIKPYYLHHGDLARGTSHLRTTIAQGQALMRALRARISGLAQPTYVLDIPGGAGKVPVGPCHLAGDEGNHRVEDARHRLHRYPPDAGEAT